MRRFYKQRILERNAIISSSVLKDALLNTCTPSESFRSSHGYVRRDDAWSIARYANVIAGPIEMPPAG